MLSSVLRSPRAVRVNVEIMRTFVRLRAMLATNAELARKLAALESKYDSQFKVVFDAIRELTAPTTPKRNKPICSASRITRSSCPDTGATAGRRGDCRAFDVAASARDAL
jgi:hypothetical protein